MSKKIVGLVKTRERLRMLMPDANHRVWFVIAGSSTLHRARLRGRETFAPGGPIPIEYQVIGSAREEEWYQLELDDNLMGFGPGTTGNFKMFGTRSAAEAYANTQK